MNDFGKNLRKLRESAGWSQEALAAALQTSTSVVNRIENNKRRMDAELIYKLQTIFEMDICFIVKAIFSETSPDRKVRPAGDLISAHYERIIEEKNRIIEEKKHYISQLERAPH